MTRVETGWIGAAGCQPAAASAARTAPPSSGPASRSISGSIRRWLTRPAPDVAERSPSRASSVNRPIPSASQRSSTGPRGAYANAHGSGPGRRSSTWAPTPVARAGGATRQPLTAFTRAQPESWRYDPSGFASTNASHAAASAGPGVDGTGRRRDVAGGPS